MRTRSQLLTAALIVTVTAVVVWVGLRANRSPEPTPSRSEEHADITVDAGRDVAGDKPDVDQGGWPPPKPGEKIVQALHEGEPVAARFVVAAPGVYPPLETTGEHATLPEPARTMAGEPVEHYEVYAESEEHGVAFWDDLDPGTDVVELSTATTVTVRLEGTPGVVVSDATVRLGRSSLGLIVQTAATADGAATFRRIPPGQYWVSVEAPGWLRMAEPIEVTSEGGQVVLQLQRGRKVAGRVTDPAGEAISGAVVSLYTADGDAPFGGVPEEIARTDGNGLFTADGIPPGQTVAIGLADGYAPTASETVDTSGGERATYDLNIQLERAVRVIAHVVDASDDPVPGAHVRWQEERSGMGGAAISGDDGVARLSSVPTGATVQAVIGRYQSPHTEVPGGSPTARIKLPVKLPGELGPWRMRLEVPETVDAQSVGVVDSAGARCVIAPMEDLRDYVLRGCGEGEATVRVHTSAGSVERTTEFRDGMTVEVDDPAPVTIDVEGVEDEQWDATSFRLVGEAGTVVEPEVEATSYAERRLTARLYPGVWNLAIQNPRVGDQDFDVGVDEDGTTLRVALVGFERHRFIVTDRFGAPVTGAYAMLFEGSRLVDVARSAGQLPITFRVRPPFDGRLLVVDPRRGEGVASVTGEAGEPVRVELSSPVLTHRVPTSRPTRDEMEDVLGARLVSDDEGWLIDFQRADPAGKRAGLERADRLVTAWSEGQTTRVVVYRKGAGYIQARVR